jgi:hypothetical protein
MAAGANQRIIPEIVPLSHIVYPIDQQRHILDSAGSLELLEEAQKNNLTTCGSATATIGTVPQAEVLYQLVLLLERSDEKESICELKPPTSAARAHTDSRPELDASRTDGLQTSTIIQPRWFRRSRLAHLASMSAASARPAP